MNAQSTSLKIWNKTSLGPFKVPQRILLSGIKKAIISVNCSMSSIPIWLFICGGT